MAEKKLKIMKDKADNSCVRKKDEFTQAYKSYANYAFSNDETRHNGIPIREKITTYLDAKGTSKIIFS